MSKKTKSYLEEVDTVRAIACLSVVLLHSIYIVAGRNLFESEITNLTLVSIANILSFGTTTFIFLSGLVLSYSNQTQLKKKFYTERIKYIVLPFIFACFIFAVYNSIFTSSSFLKYFIYNLVGYQHWFVLVVLQFYIFYPVLKTILKKYPATITLPITFIVNFLYLVIFNFFDPPSNNSLIKYIWLQGYWVPFVGWIFFFAIAFYAGRNYTQFIDILKSKKTYILTSLPIVVLLSFFISQYEVLGFGSKRVDMILLSTLMILFLFMISQKFRTPKLLNIVSRYSYGIYLLHYLFLDTIYKLFIFYDIYPLFGYFSIFAMFVLSLIASVFTIYLVNKLPFGQFMLGKVKPKNKDSKSTKEYVSV